MSDILVPADYRKQLESTGWMASVSDTERLQHAFARLGHVCSVAAVTCFYTTWSDHEEAAGWMCLPDRDADLDQLLRDALQQSRYSSIIEEFAKADWKYTEALVKASAARINPISPPMHIFKQHVPGFIDGVEPVTFKFSTTAELLSNSCMLKWLTLPKFSHFAVSNNGVMAILDDGYEWWVCGFISDPSAVDLPKWEGPKYRTKPAEESQTPCPTV